jgi:hypothetical protein
MGSDALNAYIKQSSTKSAWVWYESNAALSEGEAVCYNSDYNRSGGAATAAYPERRNRVETPSTTNAQYFAGVAARDYAAVSTGQMIEIYLPGSVCNVLVGASTVINVGFLTFDVTAATVGQFRRTGLPGRGSARPMQTTTYVATAQKCLAYLMDGEESGGSEDVQLVDNVAWVAMVGGTTNIIGVAASTGSPTEEILDGTIEGLRKKVIVVDTAVTTNEAAVDIENNDGVTLAGGALASCALGAIGDQVVLAWVGGAWRNMGSTGITES